MKVAVGNFGISTIFIEARPRLAGTTVVAVQQVHGSVTPLASPRLDFSVPSNSQYVPIVVL
jgi:hypothetical protein